STRASFCDRTRGASSGKNSGCANAGVAGCRGKRDSVRNAEAAGCRGKRDSVRFAGVRCFSAVGFALPAVEQRAELGEAGDLVRRQRARVTRDGRVELAAVEGPRLFRAERGAMAPLLAAPGVGAAADRSIAPAVVDA